MSAHAVPAPPRVLMVGIVLALVGGVSVTWMLAPRDLLRSAAPTQAFAGGTIATAQSRADPASTVEPTSMPSLTAEPAAVLSPTVEPTSVPTPSAAPTGVPTLAAAPASGPRLLLDERFADNSRGWPDNPLGTAWLSSGAYRLATRQPGQFVAVAAPLPDVLRDVVVNAVFHKTGGPAGGGFGIIVRDQGPGPRDGVNQTGRFYVLEVGDRQQVGIWRRESDHWVDLVPWVASEMVRPGTASNAIGIRATGDQLSLLVNGVEAARATDSELASGRVGIFVGGDDNQVSLESYSVQSQS